MSERWWIVPEEHEKEVACINVKSCDKGEHKKLEAKPWWRCEGGPEWEAKIKKL